LTPKPIRCPTNGEKCLVQVELREVRVALDNQIEAVEKLLEARLTAVENATRVAAQEMNRRLESMNEFREQLRVQAGQFLGRDEYHTAHSRIMEDVRFLREARAELEGKASATSVYIVYGLSFVSLVLSIIKLFK
jgi:hypothetical protein